MSQDDDHDGPDISGLTPDEQWALMSDYLDRMSPEARAACIRLMEWLAYERPKDAEPLTQEKVNELANELRLEYRRRLLGGKVGVILPFKKPETKGE